MINIQILNNEFAFINVNIVNCIHNNMYKYC